MFEVTVQWEGQKPEQVFVALLDKDLPEGYTDNDIMFYIEDESELQKMVETGGFMVDNFKLISYERMA